MTRSVAAALLCLLAFASSAWCAAKLKVDNATPISLSSAYTFGQVDSVEAAAVLQALGFESFWNEPAGKLIFKNSGGAGVLTPHCSFTTFGPALFQLPGRPVFLGGRLFVPNSFVTSALSRITGKRIDIQDFQADPVPPAIGLPYRALYLRKIVVDPGHGGHDPGARSPEGLNEKDIVLDVAKRLARRLRDEMGVEVVMTRSDDRFITLGNRSRIANTSGADLFVSIHANGAFNRTATGTETFFLSFEASDRKSAKLAEAENSSLEFDEDSPFKDSNPDDIKKILWDMVQTETLKDSERLAIAVQEKLEQQLHLPSRGVKQAPFYVLMASGIPAILVEIGFMTTSAEANQLADALTQERIAFALFQALLHYDTLMASEQRGERAPP